MGPPFGYPIPYKAVGDDEARSVNPAERARNTRVAARALKESMSPSAGLHIGRTLLAVLLFLRQVEAIRLPSRHLHVQPRHRKPAIHDKAR